MNVDKRGLLEEGALIALVFGAGAFVGVGGMAVARPGEQQRARPISA